MAEPLSAQLRRPVPLALLVTAVIGWLLFLIAIASRSSAVGEYETRLTDLSAERDTVASRLVALEEATGTLEQQQAVIVAGRTELTDLQAQIEQLSTEQQTVLAQTEDARTQFQNAQTELAALEQTLAATVQERDAALGTLEEARAELTSIEERVVARSQDLADIGERVEQARVSEAELLETIAELTDTNAALAQESADAEAALQTLREEEAQLTAAREETEDALTTLQAQAEELQTLVAALEQRREEVATDVAEAETRRGELQATVTELTNALAGRGSELAELEQRIAEAQNNNTALLLPGGSAGSASDPAPSGGVAAATDEAGGADEAVGTNEAGGTDEAAGSVVATREARDAPSAEPTNPDTQDEATPNPEGAGSRSTDANEEGTDVAASGRDAFNPGTYRAGNIDAVFSEDGAFEMSASRGRRVVGRYEASGDRMVLSEATGAIGRARFPMECELSGRDGSFTLGAVGDSCRLFDGLVFERTQ